MSFNNSMTSSSVRRSGSCRKLSSIPPRVQSRCVRSFRVSCFNWCCNAFSSLMAFRSFFSLFSNSRLSFSSFEVSGKGSVPLSRYQHRRLPLAALNNRDFVVWTGHFVSLLGNWWIGWRFTTSFWAEKKQETFFRFPARCAAVWAAGI